MIPYYYLRVFLLACLSIFSYAEGPVDIVKLSNGDEVRIKAVTIKDVILMEDFQNYLLKIGHQNGVPVEAHIAKKNKLKDGFKKILIFCFYTNLDSTEIDNINIEVDSVLPYVAGLADDKNIKLISVRPVFPISEYKDGVVEKISDFEKRLFFYKTSDNKWVPDDVNP